MFIKHIHINKRPKAGKTPFTFRLLPFAFYLFAFSLLLSAFSLKAQTFVTAPMTGTPAPGQYYNYTGITLNATFTFTPSAGQSLQLYILSAGCLPLNTIPSKSQNYIMTSVPRVSGITSAAGLTGLTNCSLMQTIQYLDGLGRPLQTVQVKGSPAGNDLVQPFAYDPYGREATKYEPYSVNSATPGLYQSTALADNSGVYTNSQQYLFYQQPGVSFANTAYPYASTNYDNSPLNRTIEQGAPGAAWQLSTSGVTGSGHTVKMVYSENNATSFAADSINGKQVALYNATINSDESRTLAPNGYYPANTLTVTISEDENWSSGRAGTVETYTDKEGHVILKRAYNYTTAVQMLSTYYVYDDLGNLAFVLPPASGADADGTISQTTLNNLCYQYQYDERGRPSQKKLPGKGWEYTAYNSIDQPVATQDSLQRAQNNWVFSKFDDLGRPVFSGIWNNSNTAISRASLQTTLTAITTNLWEAPVNTGNGYTNVAWPTSSVTETLTLDYYDSYASVPGLPSTYTVTSGVSNMTRGLPTVKMTAVLNTPTNMLWDVLYYDDLGRSIKTYAQHYLGGTFNTSNYDLVNTTYNFTNAPTTVTRQHWNTASTTVPLVTIANTYIYDNMGRKLKTWEQITNGSSSPTTKTLISQMDFNELGQVMNKHLQSTDSVTFLQNIAYAYNERNWLLQSTAPLFEMQLQYNTGTNKQYNGNIAYQLWGTIAAPNTNTYTYIYDKLNKLMSGTSVDNYKETGISYDVMGNITALNRYQANTLIDQLTYTYSSTNQVQSIADGSGSSSGLVNGTTIYSWDGNGNLASNTNTTNTGQNKSFTRNLLNLPQVVTVPTGTVTYTYDAAGNKLRKVDVLSGVTKTTDYINGIEYDNSTTTIGFIQTEEGKAVPSGTSYDYQYFLSDNLGNTRITFSTISGSASTTQTDDYYPFGLEILRGTAPNPKNEYLYNKKELQEETTEYDYGARFYDPVIARWNIVDPSAEKSREWSPYNYGENNPIKNIDVEGDSIIVASNTQFNSFYGGEVTNINVTVTGKVENDSSTPYTGSEMQGITQRVSSAIESYYTTSDNSDPNETIISLGTANLTTASSSNPVASGDDVFKIVDPGKVPDGNGGFAPSNTVGMSSTGGNVTYISTATVSETPATTGTFANTGRSDTGRATLERTSGHELGHLAGLGHPKPGTQPGNLMNQSDKPDAGTKITPEQLKQIQDNYKKGKLNNGQQSF